MAFYYYFVSISHHNLAAESGRASASGSPVFLSKGIEFFVEPGSVLADGQDVFMSKAHELDAGGGHASAVGTRVIMLKIVPSPWATDETRILAIEADYRITAIRADDAGYAVR